MRMGQEKFNHLPENERPIKQMIKGNLVLELPEIDRLKNEYDKLQISITNQQKGQFQRDRIILRLKEIEDLLGLEAQDFNLKRP